MVQPPLHYSSPPHQSLLNRSLCLPFCLCPFVCLFLRLLALPSHLPACRFIWHIGGCLCFVEDRVPPCLFPPWVCHQIGKCIKLRVRVCALYFWCWSAFWLFSPSASFIKNLRLPHIRDAECVGCLHFSQALSFKSLIYPLLFLSRFTPANRCEWLAEISKNSTISNTIFLFSYKKRQDMLIQTCHSIFMKYYRVVLKWEENPTHIHTVTHLYYEKPLAGLGIWWCFQEKSVVTPCSQEMST